jgi:hypothetical protein
MGLQFQPLRLVFGREPSKKDRIFWDRSREHEGAFPIDDAEYTRELWGGREHCRRPPGEAVTLILRAASDSGYGEP